jgi:hypothetical protein
LQRIENLWSCFNATKTLFTTFFSLHEFPLFSYPYISLAITAYLSHGLVVLFRLSTFQSPNVPWDRLKIRRELNLGELLRLWTQRWGGVIAEVGIDTTAANEEDENPWAYVTKRLAFVADWWDEKVEVASLPESENPGGSVRKNGSQLEQPPVDTIDFTPFNLQFPDDIWMQDFVRGLESNWDAL